MINKISLTHKQKIITVFPPKSQSNIQSQFSLYLGIKNKIQVPLKLQIYFTILQNTLQSTSKLSKIQSNYWVPQIFVSAFTTLSKIQKQHFLYQNILYLRQQLNPEKSSTHNIQSTPIQCIQTEAYLKKVKFGFTNWVSVHFQFNSLKRNIKIYHNKQNYIIDLRLYLIRQSKKYPTAFVLVSCSEEAKAQWEKYTFSFDGIVCRQIYKEIMICIINYRNERFLECLKENCSKSLIQNELSRISANERAIKFITSNNLKKYLNNRDEAFKAINSTLNEFVMIHQDKQAQIQTSTKQSKFYRAIIHVHMREKQLKNTFLQAINNRYIYLNYLEILQQYSKKYKVTYERYVIGNQAYQIILTKQENHVESSSDIIFIKGIQNKVTNCFLNYMYVKSAQGKNKKSKLIIYAKFNDHEQGSSLEIETIIEYLLQFGRMLVRSQRKDELNQFLLNNYQEYFSVKENNYEEDVGQSQLLDEPKLLINNNIIRHQSRESNNGIIQAQIQQKTYLSHCYLLNPIQKKEPKLVKEFFLFKEWKRKQKGGLVCINQKILNAQSQVIKHIIKNIGKKIIGDSANISLPVGVFRDQSHLTTISRNSSYAPLLFENVVNKSPLEKMKAAIIFNIGVNILGISIGKPFNPILGQTYQAWIDGCPIYMEQISHHPPIGYYLFYGRGYKIYGGVQPKAQIGINSIKACSDFHSHVKFSDGVNIDMIFGKMKLTGFIFGDREFSYIHKAFLFDIQNKLFGQIRFGPKQTGFFSSSNDPQDYVQGNIYEVTDEFVQQYKKINKIYPQKKHIIKNLSNFEGLWNQVIKIDGKQVINFSSDLPCQMVEEQFPLPSQSCYREDIKSFIEGNYEEAQKMKDMLQNIQRRDRNLRQNHKKQ